MPNRLASEKSPYLLQHAGNPVEWFPWGDEAFAEAKRADKPIFLSVGYSTCHWCHVMERESFEDDEIAAVLNRDFVSIKVDREERPDVDRVYMLFVQATTGSGGWPMSVWLTPDLQPFYGGTYFPPVSRWGKPGFADVLREIARMWHTERDRVLRAAGDLTAGIRSLGKARGSPDIPPAGALTQAVDHFRRAFDRERGGFGDAPKFPRPGELLFLFREAARTGDAGARHMALETLRAMARGAMFDHVGGGFHRYAVDAAWRVPHFEKMLYDQKMRMWDDASGRLLRRYRDGDAAIDAYAEDHAFLIFGLLELFQASHDPAWLEWAIALQARQDAIFGDSAGGGWFSTSGDDPSVLLRMKEEYDGAEPAASSVAAWNGLLLAHLTGHDGYRERAEAALRSFGPRMSGAPQAVPVMLAALTMHWTGIRQVVVIGSRDGADTRALVAVTARAFLPFSVVMVAEPGAHQVRLARLIPAIGDMRMRDGRATAYVCRDFTCRAPTTDVEELRRLLME